MFLCENLHPCNKDLAPHNPFTILTVTLTPISRHLHAQVTDLESETNVVSSSSNEKKDTMASSFVTHCASSTISPIAETKIESSLEDSKAGEMAESVIDRSFVVISKQGVSDSESVDDAVASVLMTSAERQDSGKHF